MKRRKSPEDPESRRKLAEFALEFRERIRELKLARDYVLKHKRRDQSSKAIRRRFQATEQKMRLEYAKTRRTFESLDGFRAEAGLRLLKEMGIPRPHDMNGRPYSGEEIWRELGKALGVGS